MGKERKKFPTFRKRRQVAQRSVSAYMRSPGVAFRASFSLSGGRSPIWFLSFFGLNLQKSVVTDPKNKTYCYTKVSD